MKKQIMAGLLIGALCLTGCSAESFFDTAHAIDSVTGIDGMTLDQMKTYLSDEAYKIASASDDSYKLFEQMSADVMATADELIVLFQDDAYKAVEIGSETASKLFKLSDLVLASNVIDLDALIGAHDLKTIAKRGEVGATLSFLNFVRNMSPETIQAVVKIENLKPFYYDVQTYARQELGDVVTTENVIRTLGDLENKVIRISKRGMKILQKANSALVKRE